MNRACSVGKYLLMVGVLAVLSVSPPPSFSQARGESVKAAAPKEDVTVYVTKTGKKYHRATCSSLRTSKIPIKLSEAKGRYGPCANCSPPTREIE